MPPAEPAAVSPCTSGDGKEEAGFGIYVHWPFCLSKCPYCDFNSHVAAAIDVKAWQERLLAALKYQATRVPRRCVTSVFFGGGTPSLMPPALVEAVLAAIDRLFGLDPAAEITLEANPTSSEARRFRDFLVAGVNRLSLGVQALDDAALAVLGRRHTAAEAIAAWEMGQSIFPRASFDLIYGRPGQTAAAWERELAQAIALSPGHLSAYQLTMEPGTPFFERHRRGQLDLPDEETALRLFRLTRDVLAAAGLVAYEVSNHAHPGEECRHNRLYWRHGPYLGVGPGAHGRLHLMDGTIMATQAIRAPRRWLAAAGTGGLEREERLAPEAAATEALLMGLRMAEGVPLRRLENRLGRALPATFMQTAEALAAQGLLIVDRGILRLSEEGLPLMDHLLAELVPAEWVA